MQNDVNDQVFQDVTEVRRSFLLNLQSDKGFKYALGTECITKSHELIGTLARLMTIQGIEPEKATDIVRLVGSYLDANLHDLFSMGEFDQETVDAVSKSAQNLYEQMGKTFSNSKEANGFSTVGGPTVGNVN